MKTGQSLSSLTSTLLTQLEGCFNGEKPDLVLGHGDTTTCFTTALSCFYHRIPFYHVEAGLRTHLLDTPFPEEFNRQSIAPLARHHFAPTTVERQNLLNEGIGTSSITVTGSTVHDAVELISAKNYPTGNSLPFELPEDRKIVTVTLHRREGLLSLEDTLNGIRLAAKAREDVLFICPIHPNPIVQSAFRKCLTDIENVKLVQALDYASFIKLLLKTHLVLTDSGGVQEEASLLGKRTLIARTQTERDDGIKNGLVSMVGVDPENIYSSINKNLDSDSPSVRFIKQEKRSAEIITDYIEKAVV
jgi:UDP-N-acetylglucosamine 2-epimerase (non-hydrolysing)